MHIKSLAFFLSAANSLPSDDGRHDRPASAAVVEALINPEAYDQLSSPHHRNSLQTPFNSKNILSSEHRHYHATCGAGARTGCPAFEGETRRINGRKYNLYCHNAPWGAYAWLPKSESLAECEHHCHSHDYDCNGLTFYPATGACSIIHSKDAAPYIWDNGYQKISAIPIELDVALGPGELCPLPGSDNQVWHFNDRRHRFKLSCHNQFNVQPQHRKQQGPVRDVDECAEKCGTADKCVGFHYYQPVFPGGRVDGARNCELITERVEEGDWVPIHKPNQYLAGLMVDSFSCSDEGWNRDHEGHRNHRPHDSHRRRRRRGRDGRDGDNAGDDGEDSDGSDLNEEHNRRGGSHKHGRNRHHRNGHHGKTGRDWEDDEDDFDFDIDRNHRRHSPRHGRNRRGHGGRSGRDDWEEDDEQVGVPKYGDEHDRRGNHHRGGRYSGEGWEDDSEEDFEDSRRRGRNHHGRNGNRGGHNGHRSNEAIDV